MMSFNRLKVLAGVALLALGISLVTRGAPQADAQKKEGGAAEAKKGDLPAVEGLVEHKFDREQFKKSASSIARADLLACRNLDAQITQGSDADIAEFARMLNGTYLARRTVHGAAVEMDTAWLIDIRGERGSSILIDRNNLGTQHFETAFREAQLAKPAKSTSIGMVNCSFQFLDNYYKVSDQVHIPALGKATGVELREGMSLAEAWKRIVDSGYFNRLRDGRAARLGDGTRDAVLPDGRRVTERQIEEGLAPGAEYFLPMLVGGYFEITLRYSQPPANKFADGRAFRGIHMKFDAEYRAAGIAVAPNEPTFGVEQGEFVKQGLNSSYVSFGANSWSASTCCSKNGLAGAPEMTFQRVVVGQ
jgi:hypothetical protein